MRFVDAEAIRAAAPMPELLDAIEAAYRDVAAGRDRSPVRTRVTLPEGDLLLMPGVREGDAGTSVKLVTVKPGNAERGLPTIHAVVIWLDATSGEPRAILDGGTVSNNGTWKPSPQVSLLLTNVTGLLTTQAISIRLTASSGASQVDDVYLDPFKDT